MRYPAYLTTVSTRFSGFEEIPPNWEARRLKFAVTYNDEILPDSTDPDAEIAYVDISSVDLVEGITAIENLTFEEAPSRARRVVRDGDTIISTVRTYLKAIAAIEEPPANMIVSTGFAVIRPLEFVHRRYLGYALQAVGFVDRVVANSTGVSYPAINPTTLVTIPIGYPDNGDEQKHIADFLDWKTGQIDALIAKKQQLIEKLQEQRIAVITQAVTKGLNPDAPMRDSGIPWLGQVPKHWEVMKIQHVVRMRSGSGITSSDIEEVGSYPVFGGNGKRGFCEEYTHTGHFVIIGRQGAHCGNINYADGFFWASEHAVVANPDREFDTIWFGETLRAMNLNQYSESAAQPGLSVEVIGRLKLPFPPIAEQISIAKYITEETRKIDHLSAATGKTIDRLTEYRTALITAATTGKIDVRKVKLPTAV